MWNKINELCWILEAKIYPPFYSFYHFFLLVLAPIAILHAALTIQAVVK